MDVITDTDEIGRIKDVDTSELPVLTSGIWGSRSIFSCTKGNKSETAKCSIKKHRLGLVIHLAATLVIYLLFCYLDYIASTLGDPYNVDCGSLFWRNNSFIDRTCGVEGVNCRPFERERIYPIRCTRWCDFSDDEIRGTGVYTGTCSYARQRCIKASIQKI